MNINSILNDGMNLLMKAGGISTQVNIISFTIGSSSYDDSIVQTLTGSQVVSGLIFPLRGTQGSSEAMLMENGKLLTDDKILYTGSVNISGNILIGIGSERYTIIPEGVHNWDVNGQTVYQKYYIRQTLNGSIF
jgi:hypothetical protein